MVWLEAVIVELETVETLDGGLWCLLSQYESLQFKCNQWQPNYAVNLKNFKILTDFLINSFSDKICLYIQIYQGLKMIRCPQTVDILGYVRIVEFHTVF